MADGGNQSKLAQMIVGAQTDGEIARVAAVARLRKEFRKPDKVPRTYDQETFCIYRWVYGHQVILCCQSHEDNNLYRNAWMLMISSFYPQTCSYALHHVTSLSAQRRLRCLINTAVFKQLWSTSYSHFDCYPIRVPWFL